MVGRKLWKSVESVVTSARPIQRGDNRRTKMRESERFARGIAFSLPEASGRIYHVRSTLRGQRCNIGSQEP